MRCALTTSIVGVGVRQPWIAVIALLAFIAIHNESSAVSSSLKNHVIEWC